MVYEVKYYDATTGRRTSANLVVKDWEHLMRYLRQHRDDEYGEIIQITFKIGVLEFAD